MEPYNEVIRAACGLEGCQVADLAATCPAYATLDGVHPNAAGMGQLAAGWLAYLVNQKSTGGPRCFFYFKSSNSVSTSASGVAQLVAKRTTVRPSGNGCQTL